jgi:signal transduction histidine kinase
MPLQTICEVRDQLRLVNQAIQNLERLRRARATALLRIFRETLTNAGRRANATHAGVRLAQQNPQETLGRRLSGLIVPEEAQGKRRQRVDSEGLRRRKHDTGLRVTVGRAKKIQYL